MTIAECNHTGLVRIKEKVYTLLGPSFVWNHTEAREMNGDRIKSLLSIHIDNKCNCEKVE